MLKKGMPAFNNDSDTQIKILDTATKLFALKGFKAVTLKEIAKEVGIKIASIYYYYDDKDSLIKDALLRFEEVFKEYYDWLSAANSKAESVEDVMNNLFNREILTSLNPVQRLGMSMTLKEQHNNEYAFQCALKHIYEDSIENVKAGFDRLIEKNIVPESDTKTLATLFMFCIMSGNEVRLHEYTKSNLPVDCAEVYGGLRMLITAALTEGTLKKDKTL